MPSSPDFGFLYCPLWLRQSSGRYGPWNGKKMPSNGVVGGLRTFSFLFEYV